MSTRLKFCYRPHCTPISACTAPYTDYYPLNSARSTPITARTSPRSPPALQSDHRPYCTPITARTTPRLPPVLRPDQRQHCTLISARTAPCTESYPLNSARSTPISARTARGTECYPLNSARSTPRSVLTTPEQRAVVVRDITPRGDGYHTPW